MEKFILIVSLFMIISLGIATFFYEKSVSIMPMQQVQQNQINDAAQEEEREIEFHAVTNDPISYSLQYDELHVTHNSGGDWTKVPVEKAQLFRGEYSGNKQRLIENSYLLMEERTSFIFSEGDEVGESLFIMQTLDQGETWEKISVGGPFPSLRFRKIDFVNADFGYVIVTGERTMSFEASYVFVTKDGGQHWEETNHPATNSIMEGGIFLDESQGFLSFGGFTPQVPQLYVTQDGGESWTESIIHVPEEYIEIFIVAETPEKEDELLTVLLNQGTNGDYKGGEVKGKFISEDEGQTWEFVMEVEPNETE